MARNGSGTYSLASGNPVVTGTVISSTVHNNTMSDLETAMTGSLAKNGETVLTGTLDHNGNKLILDADGDTSITADTDDLIDIEVEGVDALKIGYQNIADGSFIDLDPKAHTLDAGESFHRVNINSTNAITVPAGTTTVVTTLRLAEPNITATGTVTNAATAYIPGAPTEATNNYALWVDDGRVRVDDTMQSGIADAFGEITAATTVTGVGLASVSSSGTGVYELVFSNAADSTAEQCIVATTDGTSSVIATVTVTSTTEATVRLFLNSGTPSAINNYPIYIVRYLYT
jgi:hypothetical protein